MVLTIHVLLGLVALIAGAWNIATEKGTKRHRKVGWVFAASMGGLIVTSFGIYDMFEGFGPFHVMSLVSGACLVLAVYFPLRREQHENWMEQHYFWITFTYVGLVMATGSHFFQYGPPGWPMWARALLYWVVPFVVGSMFIYGRKEKILSRLKAGGPEGSTA